MPGSEADAWINEQSILRTSRYRKAELMGDEHTAHKILHSDSPAKAKQLGREVAPFQQGLWDRECDAVVEHANWLKFTQNEKLGHVLLATGNRRLVEASPNDRMWGIGFNSEEAEGREEEWGENRLGKALERVRDRLAKEEREGKWPWLRMV